MGRATEDPLVRLGKEFEAYDQEWRTRAQAAIDADDWDALGQLRQEREKTLPGLWCLR